MSDETPDCRACGLCCVSLQDQPFFCDVTEEDMKRLGKRFVRLNVIYTDPFSQLLAAMEGRWYPIAAIKTKWRTQRRGPLQSTQACTCVALRGSLLKQVSCRVYERRPESCREAIQPGDEECLALRRATFEAIERDKSGEDAA